MICAIYAIRRLGLPVILEFEDDSFVDIAGESENRFKTKYQLYLARKILSQVSGCVGVSPHLLSRFPPSLPRLLLRGVVSNEIIEASRETARKNWVVYSGTHTSDKGLEPLITAWQMLRLPAWELHIAGCGVLTARLEKMAQNSSNIVFHGLLNRQENARLLSLARIGINPHNISRIPGNVFAFKIIEYLAAGLHVVTTPMGALEPELEAGITYIRDNSAETIRVTLNQLIQGRNYKRTAVKAAQNTYGPTSVARAFDKLIQQVVATRSATVTSTAQVGN
jgi:glycosyltransferase involved in cell wall biosynthesis